VWFEIGTLPPFSNNDTHFDEANQQQLDMQDLDWSARL
jgi:hypothetical protein